MEDVVMNKANKDILGKFVAERIEENKKLFTKQEIMSIKNNNNLVKKIYLLGLINTIDCYGLL